MAGLEMLATVPYPVWVASISVLVNVAYTRAVLSGRLVSRSVHDEVRADRDAWHAKSDVDSQTIRVISDQLGDILSAVGVSKRESV